MRRSVILPVLAAGALVVCGISSPALAQPPELVSPVGVVDERCPTFSWSAMPGAPGYELVVYQVSAGAEVAEEPLLTTRLPGGATAWTPGATCLDGGGSYAWTVRVRGDGGLAEADGGWSEPVLFEVTAAPSPDEVQEALATLRRYLAESRAAERADRTPRNDAPNAGADEGTAAARGALAKDGAQARTPVRAPAETSQRDGTRSVAPAAAPSLGAPSLSLSSNLALGDASNLFKDGSVFLWDDTSGNTALGRLALASVSGTATRNTALGRESLRYTDAGDDPADGSENTALGDFALRANTTGRHNTATGFGALQANTTGFLNTASGSGALGSNTTGTSNTALGADALAANADGVRNTASGFEALRSNTSGSTNTAAGAGAMASNTTGYGNTAVGADALGNNVDGNRNVAIGDAAGINATSGDDNIFILNEGVSGDSGKIRIGTAGTQDGTFVAGIRGTTTGNDDAVTVVVDSAGQLGTVSSSRTVKQDVREIGELSRRLDDLRPVAFRYKEHAAKDPRTPLQFGLVAEEVAEVFPELVVRDEDGRPQTVKYHLLAALLLNELQRADEEMAEQDAELAAIQDQLRALEADPLAGGRQACVAR